MNDFYVDPRLDLMLQLTSKNYPKKRILQFQKHIERN